MSRALRKGTPKATTPALPETQTVPIKSLVRDPAYQVRAGLDDAIVHRYANAIAEGCTMPPIQVAAVNGALVVVDGWHRLAAHERRGIGIVQAVITNATASEAQWRAAAANLTHGLPLRKAEIHTAFRALIRARQHIAKPTKGAMMPGTLLSYRELAQLLGGLVRHTTVRGWMKADFPHIARRMAGEGDPFNQRESRRDEEGTFYNTVMAAVATADANAPAVRDPSRRGSMIEALEVALERVRAGGRWEASPF